MQNVLQRQVLKKLTASKNHLVYNLTFFMYFTTLILIFSAKSQLIKSKTLATHDEFSSVIRIKPRRKIRRKKAKKILTRKFGLKSSTSTEMSNENEGNSQIMYDEREKLLTNDNKKIRGEIDSLDNTRKTKKLRKRTKKVDPELVDMEYKNVETPESYRETVKYRGFSLFSLIYFYTYFSNGKIAKVIKINIVLHIFVGIFCVVSFPSFKIKFYF